jgi:nitrogen fixation/metabolism regulation signal transduction histidine kinase
MDKRYGVLETMSLRNKSILIFAAMSLIYTGFVIAFMFYLTTTTFGIWENKEIEKGLVIAVNNAQSPLEQTQAEKALRTYRQLKGLRNLFEGKIIGFSVLFGGVFFLASVILISFILFRITKPLRELSAALSKAGQGDLEIEISKPRGEIGQVAHAFNEMTVQLRRSRERLKQTERIAAWRDAARTMAHEIRNPLTAIRLSTERLIKRFKNKDKDLPKIMEKSSQMILTEINTLQKLAKEFSDFARSPCPVLKPTNLNTLIEEIITDYEDYSKGVKIRKISDSTIDTVYLDKELMRRVFLNLIKNSLDALGDSKAEIIIRTRKQGDEVIVLFEDSGSGLDPEILDRVFDPYFTTKTKGTGLGLAVVKQIIHEHRGEVSIESEPEKGTKVIIRLPLHKGLPENSGGVDGKGINNR